MFSRAKREVMKPSIAERETVEAQQAGSCCCSRYIYITLIEAGSLCGAWVAALKPMKGPLNKTCGGLNRPIYGVTQNYSDDDSEI